MRLAHLDWRSVLGRALRVVGAVGLITVAIAALTVGATWTFLQTRWGGEAIRRLALRAVNARIAGHLALDQLTFDGKRIRLGAVSLRDPDGRAVVTIERVEIVLSPFSLLRRQVVVRALSIRRPRVTLIDHAAGLNLIRAIAVRAEAATPASETQTAPSRMVVDVTGWDLTAGAIDYRSEMPGAAPRRFHLQEISGTGALRLADGRLRASVALAAPETTLAVRGDIGLSAPAGPTTLAGTLRAGLPGAALTAQGTATGDAIDLGIAVEASDLGATRRSLTPLIGASLPVMSGRGRLDVAVVGTFAAPRVQATLRFPALRIADNRLRALEGRAVVPDLRVPEALDLDLRAGAAVVGSETLSSPTLSVHTTGARLTARLHVAAPFPVNLALVGRRARGQRAVTIETLTLAYPEASWSLVRPVRLELGPHCVRLAGLALVAGKQRIEADVARVDQRVSARIAVARLDLARLPRVLVPRTGGFGGQVDARLRLDGSAARPRFDLSVKLDGGRVREVRDLALEVDARGADGRAWGQLVARGLRTSLRARFDAPFGWPLPRRSAPLSAEITVAQTDLAPTLKAVAQATGHHLPALRGAAQASLRIDGSAETPTVALEARGQGLAFGTHPIGDLAFEATAAGDHPLEAHLEATGTRGTAHPTLRVRLSTPLSVRSVLRRTPTAAELARTPINLAGEVDRAPLAWLDELVPGLPPLGGTLSSHFTLTGAALDPRGTVSLDLVGATGAGLAPTDGRVELALDARSTEARARLLRQGHPILAAEVRLGVGWQALNRAATLADAPLRVRAVLGPLALRRHGSPLPGGNDEVHALTGLAHADLSADGTLRAPRIVVHGDAQRVRLDKATVGSAEVEATYGDRQVRLEARLQSANAGALHALIRADVDLGVPAVTHLHLTNQPLALELDAQGFDLAAFSGVTPALRKVGGLLTATLRGTGTIAAPHLSGNLDWKAGTLSLTGLGDYRDIHLAAHGDENKLVLDQLVAKARDGNLKLKGEADRGTGHGYHLSAETDISRLPVYLEGQPAGVVSLEAALAGQTAGTGFHVDAKIHEARIELASGGRKDLQSLDTPADVVLTENGEPQGRAQAEKLQWLESRVAGSAPAPPGPSAPSEGEGTGTGVHVNVSATRRLWITGDDCKIELGLGPNFHVVTNASGIHVYGQVIVHRGRIDVLGRRFDLKADSTVDWNGPADRPELDISAIYENRNENVTVLVSIKGSPGQTTVKVSSPNRTDLTDSQLYALIITGHLERSGDTSGSGSFSAPGEAASLVAGLLASRLQSLAKRLPFDVLTIDPGNGISLTGTQVEAGRYVTDRLYVGYIGRIGADPARFQNRNAVRAEYQLSARWEIEGEYGDAGTGSADVVWKKNY